MENALLKGTIKDHDMINLRDQRFITRYIEAIKTEKPVRKWYGKTSEILSDDIILKYCPFCGIKL